MKKAVIIGGGAAGMTAAYFAAQNGNDVTVIERNPRPLRKVMITGKGRCNVTNNTEVAGLVGNVTDGKGRFLYSAFSRWSSKDTMEFFENHGVPLKTERGNRVFPQSDKAVDIVDALTHAVLSAGVRLAVGRVTEILTENGAVSGVKLESGETVTADAVVLATGGMSYPLTGSTGDGYEMAKKLGHTVTALRPSLIPLTVKEGFCSDLQGLSLKNISVKVTENGKEIYSEQGELMFTHYGLSGPLILSASSYIKNAGTSECRVEIDMKPALDEKKLDERILRDFSAMGRKDFINSLSELLPRKMIPVAVKLSGIEPSKKVNAITKAERERLVRLLKHLTLTVNGTRPIEEAIITKGGISLSEIDPKTMESKLVKGLFFAGEILDADAFTGGFNLQIAFSSGHAAGSAV